METIDIISYLEETVRRNRGLAELEKEPTIRKGHLQAAAAHEQAIELIWNLVIGGRRAGGTAVRKYTGPNRGKVDGTS